MRIFTLAVLFLFACQSHLEAPSRKEASTTPPAASAPSTKKTEHCKLGREAECQEECDKQDLESCTTLAQMKLLLGSRLKPKEGVALLQRACDGGVLRACGILGLAYTDAEDFDTLGADFEEALPLLQRSCDLDSAVGCIELARFYSLGAGVPKDTNKRDRLIEHAKTKLSAACQEGSAMSCSALGDLYHDGTSAPGGVDLALARESYDKAIKIFSAECNEKNEVSCFLLAMTKESNDDTTAIDAYNKACEMGHLLSCYGAIEAYRSGFLVREDKEKATKLIQAHMADAVQSCQAGDILSCSMAGQAFLDGEGVVMNEAKGNELLTLACRGGDPVSCDIVASNLKPEDTTTRKQQQELLEIGCEAGDAFTCESLADFFTDIADSTKATSASEEMLKMLDQECSFGRSTSCDKLVAYYSPDGDHADDTKLKDAKARSLAITRADCEAGDSDGCYTLADLYRDGDGVPLDRTKALELYTKACEYGAYQACSDLGHTYRFGEPGVDLDSARARIFYQKACAHGESSTCLALCELKGDGCPTTATSAPMIEIK